MEPPPRPAANRFRIRVAVVNPEDAHNVSAKPICTMLIVRSDDFPLQDLPLKDLCDAAVQRYKKLYPKESLFQVGKSQDSFGTDLFLEDRVGDIFADYDTYRIVKGSSVRDSLPPEYIRGRSVSIQPGINVSQKRAPPSPSIGDSRHASKRQRTQGIDPDRPIRSHELDSPEPEDRVPRALLSKSTIIPDSQTSQKDQTVSAINELGQYNPIKTATTFLHAQTFTPTTKSKLDAPRYSFSSLSKKPTYHIDRATESGRSESTGITTRPSVDRRIDVQSASVPGRKRSHPAENGIVINNRNEPQSPPHDVYDEIETDKESTIGPLKTRSVTKLGAPLERDHDAVNGASSWKLRRAIAKGGSSNNGSSPATKPSTPSAPRFSTIVGVNSPKPSQTPVDAAQKSSGSITQSLDRKWRSADGVDKRGLKQDSLQTANISFQDAAKDKERKAAEESAKQEIEENARKEAESKARRLADERVKREAAAKARQEAQDRLNREAEAEAERGEEVLARKRKANENAARELEAQKIARRDTDAKAKAKKEMDVKEKAEQTKRSLELSKLREAEQLEEARRIKLANEDCMKSVVGSSARSSTPRENTSKISKTSSAPGQRSSSTPSLPRGKSMERNPRSSTPSGFSVLDVSLQAQMPTPLKSKRSVSFAHPTSSTILYQTSPTSSGEGPKSIHTPLSKVVNINAIKTEPKEPSTSGTAAIRPGTPHTRILPPSRANFSSSQGTPQSVVSKSKSPSAILPPSRGTPSGNLAKSDKAGSKTPTPSQHFKSIVPPPKIEVNKSKPKENMSNGKNIKPPLHVDSHKNPDKWQKEAKTSDGFEPVLSSDEDEKEVAAVEKLNHFKQSPKFSGMLLEEKIGHENGSSPSRSSRSPSISIQSQARESHSPVRFFNPRSVTQGDSTQSQDSGRTSSNRLKRALSTTSSSSSDNYERTPQSINGKKSTILYQNSFSSPKLPSMHSNRGQKAMLAVSEMQSGQSATEADQKMQEELDEQIHSNLGASSQSPSRSIAHSEDVPLPKTNGSQRLILSQMPSLRRMNASLERTKEAELLAAKKKTLAKQQAAADQARRLAALDDEEEEEDDDSDSSSSDSDEDMDALRKDLAADIAPFATASPTALNFKGSSQASEKKQANKTDFKKLGRLFAVKGTPLR